MSDKVHTRLTLHIPGSYESVCRFYGEFSSCVRGQRKKEAGPDETNPAPLAILEEAEP